MSEITIFKSIASTAISGKRFKLIGSYLLLFFIWLIVGRFYVGIFGVTTILSPFIAWLKGYEGFYLVYMLFPILFFFLALLGDMLYTSFRWFGLDVLDDQDPSLKGLFQGLLKPGVKKVFQLSLLRVILILAWSLLFIVPGIYKAYMYSQAAINIKRDPSLRPTEAIRLSVEQMKDNRKKYFLLQMSYNIWYLLLAGLLIFMVGTNFFQIITSYQNGGENVQLFFSIIFSAAIMIVALMFIFSIFIEPQRMLSKQAFYKKLFESSEKSTYDEFEKELLKRQGFNPNK